MRFLTQRVKLRASTPLNFVCTADIANGKSGSPVVNRENEVVGVVFDGNLESTSPWHGSAHCPAHFRFSWWTDPGG